jgi:two-component system, cell cycle response regulator DivK
MNSSAPAGHTVLIVEDHQLVAKFYRMALERVGGFRCIVTEDVSEILAAVDSGQIDCALMDISLNSAEWEGRPIDGVELTRILKQRSPRRLPVLIASAHAMIGDRDRFLAASGADDYIEKPVFDADDLVRRIRKLIEAS